MPTQLTANQYLNLATQAAPNDKASYQLAAANKLIDQEKPSQANTVLKTITDTVTPEQSAEKQLLQAKVLLFDGQPQKALEVLTDLSGNNALLTTQQQVMLHQLLANTYEAIGNTTASINQRTQLQPLLTDPQAQRLNLVTIWHSLQALSPQQLTTDLNSTPSPALKGWLSLALITKQSQTPNNLIQQLRQWESEYPNHPAITLLPKNITAEVQQPGAPLNIALLLPLHGRTGTVGTAIRNGFLAAYYAAEKHQINIPHLKIYDTSDKDITQVYQQATTDGANFIVGPLLKTKLQHLANSDAITVPTLALNTLSNAPTNNKNLFQFGLSPLDEAQQAADRAWQQGKKNAVIITTNSAWGQNIADVFNQTWTHLGGHLVTTLYTSPDQSLEQQVQQLLQVGLANKDYAALRTTLNMKMRFIPRRRKDVDMIYLIEQPSIARQIVPLLKYYFAGDIPVYSISQIYNGKNNSKIDHDLNGVFFCDMPWVLDPSNESQALQDLRVQIETIWPLSFSNHKKLYALGIDAYKVTAKLQQMKTLPQFAISGATGDLYLDQASHIYRKLRWSQFRKGTPVLLR
ncbi:MAG: hypothetical protein COB66_03765 [Coxiella sp. (in: Bacteria)]|nr:MAG: hypothetical protein COB66_03765 [Coxiella sp. (in: g-proteobacteria)]